MQPIKDNNARLESALVRMTESSVSQKEMEWRTASSAEERARTEVAVSDLRASQVPRKELERVWAAEAAAPVKSRSMS
ncbi:hypothetical protein [Pararhizobium sp. PWRC1-1]|uniref:hypothetical protein n=1 Tax=Pararhizobium sp. PWRC1-1 TaxID=2804566 RepID=UPI003CF4A447